MPETVTTAMRRAAAALLATLDREQRAVMAMAENDPDRRRWTYLPGPRPGLCLEDLSSTQVDLALELVRSGSGADDVVNGAIAVERVRRTLVAGSEPDGDKYWLRLGGDPTSGDWSWRINGHHVAVHMVVRGDRYTVTPHFVGSEPAVIPSGPHAGHELLAPEEDLARDLVASLDPDRRALALPSDVAPDDVLTGDDPVADPSVLPAGLPRGDMTADQQARLDDLVHRYLSRAPADYATSCWAEAARSGLDAIEFAWLGSLERGQGHYYCLRGPTMLVEYDNTQDNANHAHSVWRHLLDDWGGDALRAHREQAH